MTLNMYVDGVPVTSAGNYTFVATLINEMKEELAKGTFPLLIDASEGNAK